MKPTSFWRVLLMGAITGFVMVTASKAQTLPAPEPPAASNQADERALDAVEAVRSAQDPSVAIEAYGRARTGDVDPLALLEAFVRRMADLGVPQLAAAQAQALTQRQPGNGLAWAVVADAWARRGQMVPALDAIVKAVHLLPDDVFVQHTAGSLLAWYDIPGNRLEVPETVRRALTQARAELTNRPAFAEAYRAAREAATEGAPASSALTDVPPVAVEPPYVSPPLVYEGTGGYDGYSVWPQAGYPGYGGPYYAGGYCRDYPPLVISGYAHGATYPYVRRHPLVIHRSPFELRAGGHGGDRHVTGRSIGALTGSSGVSVRSTAGLTEGHNRAVTRSPSPRIAPASRHSVPLALQRPAAFQRPAALSAPARGGFAPRSGFAPRGGFAPGGGQSRR